MKEDTPEVIATRRRKPRFLTEEEVIENERQYIKMMKRLWLWVIIILLVIGIVISIITNVLTGVIICGTAALIIWLISG